MNYYQLNDKITNVWQEKFECLIGFERVMKRMPSYFTKPYKNKILFIGLNPAFPNKYEDGELDGFNSNITKEDIKRIAQINFESKVKGNIYYYGRYYNIFYEIINELMEEKFEHTDMFLMRETDSKKVEKMIYNDNGNSINEFAKAQLNILWEFIIDAEPKMIIIPNKMASQIFREEFKCHFKNGFYYSERKPTTPILFSGSWQYGRLDEFTKELIVFHIKNILNKK